MFEVEQIFASVHWLKHTNYDPLSGVRRESVRGSHVVVLHHHLTVVSRCDIFMVWETPSGLYGFVKQQGCSLCVCHERQPSSKRADFKGTCMGCLLGMEHTCMSSYFLWNASSEFIHFPFSFLELNSSSTAPFYFSHRIANAEEETATDVSSLPD